MSADTQTVTIERLGHRGEGIAKGPIFVPRTLPGEVVTGVVEAGRMASPRIVTPVEQRVRPPCRHAKACGGCALQHADEAFLARWKMGVVETALNAQGVEAPVVGISTSPPRSRRRAVLAARRTKSGAQVGFHGLKTDSIVEIQECHLIRPELVELLGLVREMTVLGASRKGRLSVTLTLLDEGVDMAVSGGKPLERDLFSDLVNLVRGKNVVRLSWDGETVAAFGPAQLTLGPAKVPLPPGAFLQATREGETALVAAVVEALSGAHHVADLFAGAGTFTLPLSKNAAVHAVEGEENMLEALLAGWRQTQGLKPVTTEARDLFRRPLLPDELARYDALVLDPPRAGAEAQIAEIVRAQVPLLAMVSCNPVTFARDAKALSGAGYDIEWLRVVDQFRWSPHVELVARFLRQGSKANSKRL